MNSKAYNRKYYKDHAKKLRINCRKYYCKNKNVILERMTKRYEIGKQYAKGYLATHPCIDCGETDIIVLQFDHVRGKKTAEISSLYHYSVLVIQKEIDKCEVRCANCHFRRHYKEGGACYLSK